MINTLILLSFQKRKNIETEPVEPDPEPIFESAEIKQSAQNVINLLFDIDVNITIEGWAVVASGGVVTITSVIDGNGTNKPKFSLSRIIMPVEVVTISYASGVTESILGVQLQNINSTNVINNVHIYVDVNFGGDVIDTFVGSKNNPDVTNLSITQSDSLRFTRVTDVSIATLQNFWVSDISINRGVFSVNCNRVSGYTASIWLLRVWSDSSNYIQVFNSSGSANINIVVGGVTQYSFSTGITVGVRYFKISYDSSNDIKFYYYNSGWVQLGVTQNMNVGSSFFLRLESLSSATDAPGNVFAFDTVRITDVDYTDQFPETFFL